MDLTAAMRGISRATQALLALAVTSGVLLMHGVAADHAMPMTSHGSAVGTHATAVASGVTSQDGHGTDALVGAVLRPAERGSQAMVGGCVAVLVSWLLLPLLGFRRLRTRTRDSGHSRPPRLRRGNNATASLWLLTPSLTRLGIARI